MKSAVKQAKGTYNQAVDTSGMLGSEAQGIGSNLTPFLTSEMLHPEGLGQEGIGAETGAALGGAGGAMSGFSGGAAQRAAASRNAGGYGAALADAARERMKAAAGASEGIQAQNENLKQQQRQEGAADLGNLYGTDTSGMLNAMNQQRGDIQTELQASEAPEGWMSTANNLMGTIGNATKLGAGFNIPGFAGFGAK